MTTNMEERRGATIEHLLESMGEIKQIGKQNSDSLRELNEKVAIQNGRVGKLENWRSYMLGAVAVLSTMMLSIMVPVSIAWLHHYLNR